MRRITVTGVAGSLGAERDVSEHHARQWVRGEGDVVLPSGVPVCSVRQCDNATLLARLVESCRGAEFPTMNRRGHIISQSLMFGRLRNHQQGTVVERWPPEPLTGTLHRLAVALWSLYGSAAPTLQRKQRHPRGIAGTAWTTGTINANSAVTYHRDVSNARGCWSGMIVLSAGVSGGDLILPEFGVGIRCTHGTAVFFNGSEHTHGVTEINRVAQDGYRYSIPFYTLMGV